MILEMKVRKVFLKKGKKMVVTPAEFEERLKRLQRYLGEKQIDVVLLNQNSDLYYYTGSVQPLYVLVPAAGPAVALARKAINRISEEVRHLPFEAFRNTEDLVRIIAKYGLNSPKRVGFALDITSYNTVSRFQRLFGTAQIVDISWDLRTLRMVKSAGEILILTRTAELMADMPEVVKANFRPGMTELELSLVVETHFRLRGHTAMLRCRREGVEVAAFGVCSAGINSLSGGKFDGICVGKGLSPAMPYGAASDPIPKSAPIIVDFAFVWEGYHVDLTRMFSWGRPSEQIMEAYDAMVKVEQAIIDDLLPGRICETIYTDAARRAGELGYAKEFMGLDTEKVKFVGHGVGLELDEPPYLAPHMKIPLEEGMVLAVEPKVSLPGIGVVGIEDTLVIRNQSPECLTTCSTDWVILD
jgi:Xaa-Pro dipeptidase